MIKLYVVKVTNVFLSVCLFIPILFKGMAKHTSKGDN